MAQGKLGIKLGSHLDGSQTQGLSRPHLMCVNPFYSSFLESNSKTSFRNVWSASKALPKARMEQTFGPKVKAIDLSRH